MMPNWLCIKCLHEFPDEGVKKQPEYIGMALFVTIGAALLLYAASCVYFYLSGSHAIELAAYGALAAVLGVGAISMGLKFRKGVKAICPACGKPQGVPADGKIADEVRRNRKKS
jgi:hypothetical protein